LCANKPKRDGCADVFNGTTIDQMIARSVVRNAMPSLQLAVEDPGAIRVLRRRLTAARYEQHSWSSLDATADGLNPQVTFEDVRDG